TAGGQPLSWRYRGTRTRSFQPMAKRTLEASAMGCDMVVALGPATVDGLTLFGHNSGRPVGETQHLCLVPGRLFAPGEKVHTQFLELPQVRQTCSVLGSQPDRLWGYQHGVNEHGVAIGLTRLRSRLRCSQPSLLGADLVRLALERAHNARQAVALLTDLITRHGQGCFPGSGAHLADAEHDNAFLIADAREAFAVEAAGVHWVYQELKQVRAMSDVCTVRQDWDWISRGLATHAIEQGWWPADGTKLDFAGTVTQTREGHAAGLRRWGRATLLLE